MISCKDAGILIEKRNAKKIGFIERLKLRLHLLICDACTRYNIQSKWIDKALAMTETSDEFSTEEKDILKKIIS